MVTSLMAGARASSSSAFTSGVRYWHLSSVAPPEANFMAKAKQVGKPHSLQFFLPDSGSFLTTSVPLAGMINLLLYYLVSHQLYRQFHLTFYPGVSYLFKECNKLISSLGVLFSG